MALSRYINILKTARYISAYGGLPKTYRISYRNWGISARNCQQVFFSTNKYNNQHYQQPTEDSLPKEKIEKLEFQAETRTLLDIVAKSLYSEKEVFIRELISNASDALEKLRHLQLTSQGQSLEQPLEIHIETDKIAKTFSISDTGIGMDKSEIIENLGTIARSGSKDFLQELKKSDTTSCSVNKIIGQFGVGFYSTFMVANKVEVYTLSHKPNSKAYKWISDGTGTYEISEAEVSKPGTKLVAYLKDNCSDFSNEDIIKDIIQKYSNFVNHPIFLNGKRANSLEALWLMDPKEVTSEMHEDFYRFIAKCDDSPRYILHYSTDAPINLRCLLYVPTTRPRLHDMSQGDVGVSLYSQRVLIKNKAEIFPKWLWFIKGVIDSEDIPLNLSRELLQDSALIRRISSMITSKLMRYLQDQRKKDPETFAQFYDDCSIFLKDGILAVRDQVEKEDIAKLLLFESSLKPAGEKINVSDYCSRMKDGQMDIYYLAAPSRQLAETSPYYEAVRQKDVEVLFCFEPYDEMVVAALRQFNGKNITSVETQMRRETEDASTENLGEDDLQKEEAEKLIHWLSNTLQDKVHKIKVTKRLSKHPCLISVEEMSAARHYARTSLYTSTQEDWYRLLQPTMELNLSHPIIKKLNKLQQENPKLADMLAHQVFDTALVSAGLLDDPRKANAQLNELLLLLLEKH